MASHSNADQKPRSHILFDRASSNNAFFHPFDSIRFNSIRIVLLVGESSNIQMAERSSFKCIAECSFIQMQNIASIQSLLFSFYVSA